MKDDYKFEKIFISVLEYCNKIISPGLKYKIYIDGDVFEKTHMLYILICSGSNGSTSDKNSYYNQSFDVCFELSKNIGFEDVSYFSGFENQVSSNDKQYKLIYTGVV